jgi:microcystin-dependent protein
MNLNKALILDVVYPVGSIYMSVTSTNPSSLFGGTWEQLKDRFLLGAGDTYSNGATGGEATHTLTIQEMPSHNHTGLYQYSAGPFKWGNGSTSGLSVDYENANKAGSPISTGATGGDANDNTVAHNNMPPYLVVYMWKRTA